MHSGEVIRGRDQLRKFERGLRARFPDRGAVLVRKIVSGDTVVVELERRGYAADGSESVRRSSVVLTFNDAAQIVSDHSYANMMPSALAIQIDPDVFACEMIRRGSSA
jgi:hypothetical protein